MSHSPASSANPLRKTSRGTATGLQRQPPSHKPCMNPRTRLKSKAPGWAPGKDLVPLAPIPASRGLAHTGQKAGSPREKPSRDVLTESEGQTEQQSQLKGLDISNPSDTFFATSAQSEGTPKPSPSGLFALSLSSQWLGSSLCCIACAPGSFAVR